MMLTGKCKLSNIDINDIVKVSTFIKITKGHLSLCLVLDAQNFMIEL